MKNKKYYIVTMQVSVCVEAYSQDIAKDIAMDSVSECEIDRIMNVECIYEE